MKDGTHAQLQNEGFPLPSINVILANGTSAVATDWDSSRTYSPDDNLQSNADMKRIFVEDQRVRQPGANIEWDSIAKADADRRLATMPTTLNPRPSTSIFAVLG
jgi:hypothetical protein